MGTARRIVFPGGIYHVNTHSLDDLPVLGDDVLRELFLVELAKAVAKFELICDAFCLMTNHYHLLLRTPQGLLSEAMQQLNANFARIFDRRVGRHGPVWEARFHDDPIETDGHLLQSARYIVLNPVRAGICADPADYRWSSYRASAGLAPQPRFLTTSWLLAQLGGPAGYRSFVREGAPAATLRGLMLAA
jgi:REP element-mobilizing transposase RayT